MCVCAANVSNLVIQLVRPCIICVNSFATMSAPSSGRQRLQRQVSESILDQTAEMDACTLASTDAEAMDTDTEPDSCDATICDLASDRDWQDHI